MLQIRDLNVEIEGKEILHSINLSIGAGETHAIFGPTVAARPLC